MPDPDREPIIVDTVRTPTGKGKPGGLLAGVHPVDLLADALQGLVARTELDPAAIDDVIGGCVTQGGEQGANITRKAVLAAGFPVTVPATTVDRQCGSSQQAVHFAAHVIAAGAADVVVACGVESMSRAPMLYQIGDADSSGSGLARRFPDGLVSQGIAAELVAQRWDLDRSELDAYAAESHRRAAEASAAGAFNRDLVSLLPDAQEQSPGQITDETIRPGTTPEDLASLASAFMDSDASRRFPHLDGRVTAGNSSPLSDGGAAVLLTSAGRARDLGLRAQARIRATAAVGADPLLMLMGVVPATRKVLKTSGLEHTDMDLFEVNEAFASVPLAWAHETKVDLDRLNVHGGAIALGHPLGATGARLLTTLLGALERRGERFGLHTMCEAGGMANATIVERLENDSPGGRSS